MNRFDLIKQEIINTVSTASGHRMDPHELEEFLAFKLGVSLFRVKKTIKDLVEEGDLVLSYLDPYCYLEIPSKESRSGVRPIRLEKEGGEMNQFDHIKSEIMKMMRTATNHRLRPHEIEKALYRKLGIHSFTAQGALDDLVKEEKLVFTYWDPESFVELPLREIELEV